MLVCAKARWPGLAFPPPDSKPRECENLVCFRSCVSIPALSPASGTYWGLHWGLRYQGANERRQREKCERSNRQSVMRKPNGEEASRTRGGGPGWEARLLARRRRPRAGIFDRAGILSTGRGDPRERHVWRLRGKNDTTCSRRCGRLSRAEGRALCGGAGRPRATGTGRGRRVPRGARASSWRSRGAGGWLVPSPRPRASLTDLTVPHALQLLVTSPVSPIGQCLAPHPVPRGCPASVFGRHG